MDSFSESFKTGKLTGTINFGIDQSMLISKLKTLKMNHPAIANKEGSLVDSDYNTITRGQDSRDTREER